MANPKLGGKPALMTEACEALPATDHERIACGLHMASRGMSTALTRVARPHGLSGMELNLLLKVEAGHRSPSVIATWLGVDASSLSRLIRSLENKKLLTRTTDASNRSRAQLSLTAKGEKQAAAIAPQVRTMEKRVLKSLTGKDVQQFKTILQKLCVGLLEPSD